jgi:short-subunit dehydrogenase
VRCYNPIGAESQANNSRAFTSHPDIDCVFLNAGTQSQANFAQPDTVDLARFHRDVTVNFSAHVALVHAVLPYLLGRKEQTSLIFTGTPISLIPVFISPAYSSSKAALDGFLVCLREQLRSTNVKVAHISPGPVQTELHGTVVGNEAVAKFGMSINDFVEEAYKGLVDGKDDIFPGTVGGSTKEQFLELVKTRDEAVGRLNELMHKMMQKH